jgi:hypothetical protein
MKPIGRATQRGLLIWGLVISLVAAAQEARASLGFPVWGQPVNAVQPAAPGIPFEVTIRVRVAADLTLSNFGVDGDDWLLLGIQAPASVAMAAGDSVDVTMTIQSDTPDSWLILTYDSDAGQQGSWHGAIPVNVGPSALRHRQEIPWASGAYDTTAVANRHRHELITDADSPLSLSTAREITVSGRFGFTRLGEFYGADHVTVEIIDDDNFILFGIGLISGETLAVLSTDDDGWFSATFYWDPGPISDRQPDLAVKFTAENDYVRMVNPLGWDLLPGYVFNANVREYFSDIEPDYAGTNLSVGVTLTPEDSDQQAVIHIHNSITRTSRWLAAHTTGAPQVDVRYPLPGGAYYMAPSIALALGLDAPHGSIQLPSNTAWSDGTHVHEFGHHWLRTNAFQPLVPDYWNGVCDPSFVTPGHCSWCGENEVVAWTEGFGDWLGDMIPPTFVTDYGFEPFGSYDYEGLESCEDTDGNPCSCPALETEGLLAALLVDLTDPVNADDNHGSPSTTDRTSLDPEYILELIGNGDPETVSDFLDLFRAQDTSGTVGRQAIWETALNVGYQLDVEEPETVSDAENQSTSHLYFGETADATIDFTFGTPSDDWSGLAGFGILISSSSAAVPPTSVTEAVPFPPSAAHVYTTPSLAAGTWYVHVRSIDYADRHSSEWATFGPYYIREAIPQDPAYALPPATWSAPIVPRLELSPDHLLMFYPESLVEGPTYLNLHARNHGDVAISELLTIRYLIDGAERGNALVHSMAAGGFTYATNLGPFNVAAGRHTVTMHVDPTDVLVGENEDNNIWGKQYIWEPILLSPGTATLRSTPPERDGGHTSIIDGSPIADNCDALAMSAEGTWHALVIESMNTAANYDTFVHTRSTGPTDTGGLAAPLAGSERAAGAIDAVFANGATAPDPIYDVSVVRTSSEVGDYRAVHLEGTSFPVDAPTVLSFGPNQLFAIREVVLSGASTGTLEISVDAGAATGDLSLGWLDASRDLTGLDDIPTVRRLTDGILKITVDPSGPGTHAFVLYRDSAGAKTIIDATVTVRSSMVDVVVADPPPGWFGSFVPRATADATAGSVALSPTLPGDAVGTYLNVAVGNISGSPAVAPRVRVSVDGIERRAYGMAPMPPYSTRNLLNLAPIEISAGRHTLAVSVSDSVAGDLNPDNGQGAEQFVWSSTAIARGTTLVRPAPPRPLAGWELVRDNTSFWFNCAGATTGPITAGWLASAVLPNAGDDVDIRAHVRRNDALRGYEEVAAASGWGPGQMDYVLVNATEAGLSGVDFGIVKASAGQFSYRMQTVESLPPLTISGPVTFSGLAMGANDLVVLHDLVLPAGIATIRLESSDQVDLGMSIHVPNRVFQSRSSVGTRGASWLAAPGDVESVDWTGESGRICVAVWRAGAAEIGTPATYQLVLGNAASDVEVPEITDRELLINVSPNPFNPDTEINFEIDSRHVGQTTLAVFDLRGRVIRNLFTENVAAPRRITVRWNGTDDSGHRVSSGVYYLRLKTETGGAVRKIGLVK